MSTVLNWKFHCQLAQFQKDSPLGQLYSVLMFIALKIDFSVLSRADSALFLSEIALILTRVDETIKMW